MNLLRLSSYRTDPALQPARAGPASRPADAGAGRGHDRALSKPLARADTKGFAPIAELFARADMGIANFEGASFNHTQFPGVASAETGGGYPVIAPANVEALARSGIRLVAKANNHGTDWGYTGLAATLATLRNKGIAQAGAGRTWRRPPRLPMSIHPMAGWR
jgi:poly-gamma-glutamate capsule biosynthesis protein CapA/YwtB (metallophosphatase superfamily)